MNNIKATKKIKNYVTTETANPYKNQSVIITLLDEPQPVRKPVTLEKLESFAMLSNNADDAQNYISKMRAEKNILQCL